MTDTRVILGDVTFASYEVPENIPWGGDQATICHKLLGGARVIDAMGVDDRTLAWSGRFQGPTARDRARHLDYLRRQGIALTLSWDTFIYQVVIKRFSPIYERFYQIPYAIECEVVQDLTADVPVAPQPSFDDLIDRDTNDSVTLAAGVGDPVVTSDVDTLQTNVDAVPSFQGATAAQLAPVNSALATAQADIAARVNTNNGAVLSGSGIAGVVSGTQPPTMITGFNAQLANMTQLSLAVMLQQKLGRLGNNVVNVRF
jgi:hypothetical protein